MNELAAHVGREQTFDAAGRTWKLSRWERRVWWELLEWARPQIPDPVESIAKHLDKLPPDVARYAVDKALAASRIFLSINSPEVQSLIESLEGGVRTLYLLLREHQPEATEDDAYRIAISFGHEKLQRLFEVALGKPAPSGSAEKKT